jgi:hypothetical protein
MSNVSRVLLYLAPYNTSRMANAIIATGKTLSSCFSTRCVFSTLSVHGALHAAFVALISGISGLLPVLPAPARSYRAENPRSQRTIIPIPALKPSGGTTPVI